MSGGDPAHGQSPGDGEPSVSHPFSDWEPPPPDDEGPQRLSRDEWMGAVHGDIPPENFAGEGYGATEEYFPQDIDDPGVRGKVTGEGDYYPAPDPRRRRWPPYRGMPDV